MFKEIYFFFTKSSIPPNTLLSAVLLASILAFLPFKFLFSNIALFLFLAHVATTNKVNNFKFDGNLIAPILLYLVMVFSLFWSNDATLTKNGIIKEIPFLLLPVAFMFYNFSNEIVKQLAIRLYAFSMVLYAISRFLIAAFRFSETNNKNVFLFHELVSIDVNAIYMSCFASFCLFYFVQIKDKKVIDFIAIYILCFFVLLLSSKTIIFIDICLLMYFYVNHAAINRSVKFATISMAGTFVFLSMVYVPQLQKRILDEYQTAFVDNTVNSIFGTKVNKVYNVSLKQAWSNKDFRPGDFLPGTAFRVFHVRLFKELYVENNFFWTGFGQDASYYALKQKYKQYKMFSNLTYANFHNQFFQVFAELGIFGLALFIIVLFVNIKNAFISNDFMHIVFSFSTFILFLTESMLTRQRGILFFITLYCIFNVAKKHPNLKNIE